ncbi:MAG: CDP-alcohol phosphatidyltransferase family protein [Myxococcales bacterium]|nr:CDP-alcohol phosphatidyltransferase family protein [Myxococcales bacterium]
MPPGRPWITANMVTVARLIPMPVLAWALYQQNTTALWICLVVGTLVGCTDFVDGYLARKQGPTVLGGLLDPMADKIFVALVYAPFADIGFAPAWACALIFVREFAVTALRSSYERRALTMKTSYLAKVKTWTQMQALAMLVLLALLKDDLSMRVILWIGVIAPLVALAGLWLIKKRFWPGAVVMSAMVGGLLATYEAAGYEWAAYYILITVVVVTWLSGGDYLMASWRSLRGRGDIDRFDLVRMVAALAIPVLVFIALELSPRVVSPSSWALLAVLAAELSVGGLDNLLAHHKAASRALVWGARTLTVALLLLLALLLPAWGTSLFYAAAVVSLVGVAGEFWRGRHYYLDSKLRHAPLV